MADPSVQELRDAIKDILKGADLDNLSTKKIRKQLESKFDADFSDRKKEIDKLVMKIITENEDADGDGNKSKDEEDDRKGKDDNSDVKSDEDEVPTKKVKTVSSSKQKSGKRKSAGKADDSEDPVMSSIKNMDDEDLAKKLQEEESGLRRRAARRPAAPKPKREREVDPEKKKKSTYSRPCQLSEKLAEVVGTNEMPRSEVVKSIWSIVKEKNLQDPDNKQFMLCDAQMESLFGKKRVRIFGMMKYLKKHIKDILHLQL